MSQDNPRDAKKPDSVEACDGTRTTFTRQKFGGIGDDRKTLQNSSKCAFEYDVSLILSKYSISYVFQFLKFVVIEYLSPLLSLVLWGVASVLGCGLMLTVMNLFVSVSAFFPFGIAEGLNWLSSLWCMYPAGSSTLVFPFCITPPPFCFEISPFVFDSSWTYALFNDVYLFSD